MGGAGQVVVFRYTVILPLHAYARWSQMMLCKVEPPRVRYSLWQPLFTWYDILQHREKPDFHSYPEISRRCNTGRLPKIITFMQQNKINKKKATQYVVCYKVSPHTHVLGTWCSGDDAIWGGCGNLRRRSLAGGGGYLGLCLWWLYVVPYSFLDLLPACLCHTCSHPYDILCHCVPKSMGWLWTENPEAVHENEPFCL